MFFFSFVYLVHPHKAIDLVGVCVSAISNEIQIVCAYTHLKPDAWDGVAVCVYVCVFFFGSPVYRRSQQENIGFTPRPHTRVCVFFFSDGVQP